MSALLVGYARRSTDQQDTQGLRERIHPLEERLDALGDEVDAPVDDDPVQPS